MPVLSDLFDLDLLATMLADRYVSVTHHPTLPLRIYNYTVHAQFDRKWNPVTTQCRGLIVDDNDVVVARPFAKFFNLSDYPRPLRPKGPISVTEKLDGSLGIMHPNTAGGFQIATKGSFVSVQALHATKLWTEKYAPTSTLNPDWTYLFEIIYPENRIVIDYVGRDELVLLGAIDTASGQNITIDRASQGWSGPVVESHDFASIDDLLASPERSGKEGFVVYFAEADVRVKVKHQEYLQLHKLITDVSERRVWEALSAGIDTDLWLRDVPDEFFSFVSSCRQDLSVRFTAILDDLQTKFSEVTASLPVGFSRREFAAVVLPLKKTYPHALGLFMILDGTSPDKFIWNFLKPVEHLPLFTQNNTSD